jgi:cell division protein FtsW (lipid II flippase)
MDKKLLAKIASVSGILLIGAMVYVSLVRNEFPLTLMIVTLIVSLVLLYLLRDVLLRPQDGDESPLLKGTGGWLLGMGMVIAGSFFYDYAIRQEMRWEFYTGMGLPLLVIGVWWFFSKRRHKSSGRDGQ